MAGVCTGSPWLARIDIAINARRVLLKKQIRVRK
jgi:hypothetical protein